MNTDDEIVNGEPHGEGTPLGAEEERALNLITEKLIGCAFKVGNKLGSGFLEKVYRNAMVLELERIGLHIEKEKPISIYYDGVLVGEYYADLMVEGKVIVELKSVRNLDEVHTAQCLNYLAATNAIVCLLINFGKRVQVRRYRK